MLKLRIMSVLKHWMFLFAVSLLLTMTEVCSWKLESKRLFHLLKPDNYNNIKPSAALLPVNPIESKDAIRTPPHIDIKWLQNKLGNNFDKNYMSITMPSTQSHAILGGSKGRRPKYVKQFTRTQIQDGGNKLRLKVNDRTRRKVQNYIWAFTMCPVVYSWKNLGLRFWPQWIKEGKCPQKSCSIPPGMSCTPRENILKTILRWHCSDFRSKTECRWILIEYPVITKCQCSCS